MINKDTLINRLLGGHRVFLVIGKEQLEIHPAPCNTFEIIGGSYNLPIDCGCYRLAMDVGMRLKSHDASKIVFLATFDTFYYQFLDRLEKYNIKIRS